jgi:GNAT superfamily N-acetyltransferase
MPTQSATAPQLRIHEQCRGEFLISTDPARLDLDAIHGFLTRGYFDTVGINKDTLARAIRGSVCFGIYEGERQVGFARVVSDFATFAYLADDYVLESHRGRGLGRFLMECIGTHPDLQGIRRWILGPTHDTRLYEKFGFRPLKDTWMERVERSSDRVVGPSGD